MGFENGKLVRVTLRASAGSLEQVNTLHYDAIDNTTGDNNMQDLADRIRDDVRPGFAAHYNSAWTIDPVVVTEEKDPLNPTAPRSQWSSGAAIAGTQTGVTDFLPPGSSVVVTWLTTHIGRRFRGRMFIGGSRSEGEQQAGVWGSSFLAGEETYVGNIPLQPDVAGFGSDATCNLCVYSRTQRAANLDPYASHVTSHVIRSAVHFLRRRSIYA